MHTLLHHKTGGQVALIFLFLANHRVAGDKYCGVDLDDAQSTCYQPCRTDGDCCAISQQCFEAGSSCGSSDTAGTNHNFCGVSWCDAAYTCGTPCPEQTECPDGEYCFANIPCDSESPVVPPPLPPPPTSSPFQFCGASLSDARIACLQPCPRGEESECCPGLGLGCFDTSSTAELGDTCSIPDLSGSVFFGCGRSWCDAAYSCQDACPGGSSDECPSGLFCFADVPCSGGQELLPVNVKPPLQPLSTPQQSLSTPLSTFSQYCGTSAENAAEVCWQPCRDDGDCCAGQTCYSEVTACTPADNIGADHNFCGSDFCDASYECRAPCPTGFDAECPSGYRCFPNTPCNGNMILIAGDELEWGVPVIVKNLIRQYRAEEYRAEDAQPQTNTAPGQFRPEDWLQNTAPASGQVNSSLAGIFVGIALVCMVASDIVWSRKA